MPLGIAPLVIMHADVAHLVLPTVRVVWRIRQAASFEALNKHVAVFTGYFRRGPIRFGDRESDDLIPDVGH